MPERPEKEETPTAIQKRPPIPLARVRAVAVETIVNEVLRVGWMPLGFPIYPNQDVPLCDLQKANLTIDVAMFGL